VHARAEVVPVPAAKLKLATACVPETVAETFTVPGVDPNVTSVCACPAAFVATLAGETFAAPLVTANVTVTPSTGAPVDPFTSTASGIESG